MCWPPCGPKAYPPCWRLAREFDGVELDTSTIGVSAAEIAEGAAACPLEVRKAIDFAAGRIRAYHERQRPADQWFTDEAGVSWAGAGRHWSRRGSMCPADGRPIPPPC